MQNMRRVDIGNPLWRVEFVIKSAIKYLRERMERRFHFVALDNTSLR